MKNTILLFTGLLCLMSATVFGQLPPVRQASAEAKERQKDKADYKEFRKQLTALKEFAEEKKKIPRLQKESKETIKVVASIDSTDGGDEKTLNGYITRQAGDNSINIYEVAFDRATRKITTVKKTAEAIEAEAAEAQEKTEAKPAATKKPATAKKKKTGDDDDEEEEADEPEEKPSKTSKKDKDEE